jgi:hypothetical protein
MPAQMAVGLNTWAATEQLAAPHLVMVEAANILRRTVLAGELSAADGGMAHLDLVTLTNR